MLLKTELITNVQFKDPKPFAIPVSVAHSKVLYMPHPDSLTIRSSVSGGQHWLQQAHKPHYRARSQSDDERELKEAEDDDELVDTRGMRRGARTRCSPSGHRVIERMSGVPGFLNKRTGGWWDSVELDEYLERGDREQLGVGSQQTTSYCEICLESNDSEGFVSIEGCGHSFCRYVHTESICRSFQLTVISRACLVQHLYTKISERQAPILCPLCQIQAAAGGRLTCEQSALFIVSTKPHGKENDRHRFSLCRIARGRRRLT